MLTPRGARDDGQPAPAPRSYLDELRRLDRDLQAIHPNCMADIGAVDAGRGGDHAAAATPEGAHPRLLALHALQVTPRRDPTPWVTPHRDPTLNPLDSHRYRPSPSRLTAS